MHHPPPVSIAVPSTRKGAIWQACQRTQVHESRASFVPAPCVPCDCGIQTRAALDDDAPPVHPSHGSQASRAHLRSSWVSYARISNCSM